ncbi:MAG: hypothetical protein E7361_03160 [Clostridiales bacterium]|nr:hypothetical protein [Clostridiales bacterium]
MKKNVYLIKKVSQKEGKDPFTYVQLYVDLGYDKVVLSMDKTVISQVLDCAVSDLYSIEADKPVLVSILSKVEVK